MQTQDEEATPVVALWRLLEKTAASLLTWRSQIL